MAGLVPAIFILVDQSETDRMPGATPGVTLMAAALLSISSLR
jgi:hypothetical protein